EIEQALTRLEGRASARLGDSERPLLVSVLSGARESMPGMLDSVLNLGLNDATVAGLARASGDERFAWDSYRRFAQMFGNVVRGIPGERFEEAITRAKRERRVEIHKDLSTDARRELTATFRALYELPSDPLKQLD